MIDSDQRFAETASVNGWPGSGSEDDPFIIEDLVIDGNGNHYGLVIRDTSSKFMVQNCTIFNVTGPAPPYGGSGIYLLNTTGNVTGNSIFNCSVGINLEASSGTLIDNNECSNVNKGIIVSEVTGSIISGNSVTRCELGIRASSSHNLTIKDNVIDIADQIAVWLYTTTDSVMKNNSIKNSDFGLLVDGSSSLLIQRNRFRNQDDHHIRIDSSCHILVRDNEARDYGDGLHLAGGSNNITAINNTLIDNGEYGIYIGSGCYDNRFHDNSMIGCSFYIEPVMEIVRRQEISPNNTVNGGSVRHHHDEVELVINRSIDAGQIILGAIDHAQISQCDLSDGTVGIEAVECRSLRITGCSLSGNFYYGLFGMGNQIVISEFSEISRNLEGIFLTEINSQFILNGCDVIENEVGVHIIGPTWQNRYMENHIEGNIIGMKIERGWRGPPEYNDDMSYNVFKDNLDTGLYLDTSFIDVRFNEFVNGPVGILSRGSDNEMIEDNTFRGCGIGIDTNSEDLFMGGNTFSNCTTGIRMLEVRSGNSEVRGNRLSCMKEYGLFMVSSEGLDISSNKVTDCGLYGMEFYGCGNIRLEMNSLLNCSFHISGDTVDQFRGISICENNTVDLRPVYMKVSGHDMDIDAAHFGQVIIVGAGSIETGNMVSDSITNSMLIAFCTDVKVSNCTFRDQYNALELFECSGVIIDDIQIMNVSCGIKGLSTDHMLIEEVSFDHIDDIAIDLRDASLVDITDCSFREGNGTGVILHGCLDVDIRRDLFFHLGEGVHITGSTRGTHVSGNLIMNSSGFGLRNDKGCRYNKVDRNCFNFNNGTNFNDDHEPQVQNSDSSTEFDHNHWNTWEQNSDDIDEDGILDDPYWVGPGIYDHDAYPLRYPPEAILPPPRDPFANIIRTDGNWTFVFSFGMDEGLKAAPDLFTGIEASSNGKTSTFRIDFEGNGTYYLYPGFHFNGSDIEFRLHTESLAGISRTVTYVFPELQIPPFVRMVLPTKGSVLNSSIVRIGWEAHSNVGGGLLELFIDHNGLERTSIDPSRINGNLTMDAVEGMNTVSVIATDHFGNTAEDTVKFLVDTLPPSFFVEGGGLTRNPVLIQWGFDNHENGTLRMYWRSIGQEWTGIDPFDGSLQLTLPDGGQIVELMARDLAGNVFTSRVELTIDNDPPGVLSWGPAEWEPNDPIFVIFSEPMDQDSIFVSIPGMDMEIDLVDDDELHIIPLMVLDRGMRFNVTLGGSDLAGNEMETFGFVFSTGENIPGPMKGDLMVHVMDQGNDPIPGAKVTLFPLNEQYVDMAGTGVSIYDLDPGEYEMMVEAEGYIPRVITVTINAGKTTSEVVILSKEKDDQKENGTYFILAAAFIIVVTALVVLILLMKRDPDLSEE
ncbi:MAG: right-handed parallel beta-helix repeat-containing protein [Candidatus Thermoplasmatota archaeon]|nr:right-handed parallel beta-helix repeat-containing protein [Candidatus Thermoplasmatota archaeon]